MKINTLLTTFLLVFFTKLFCQQIEKVIPVNVTLDKQFKKPNAFEFNNYANEELVDLYTGMISVNVPITKIIDKDLEVPVFLNYRKDGIKVNEIAGRTGLGWDLVSGGYIYRELKGNPDEVIMHTSPSTGVEYYHNMGRFVDLVDFIYKDNSVNNQLPLGNFGVNNPIDYYVDLFINGVPNCDMLRSFIFAGTRIPGGSLDNRGDVCQAVLYGALTNTPHYSNYFYAGGDKVEYFWNKNRDTQPDIFHYQLPSGKSGSFILDDKGTPQIISGVGDVVIKPAIGPLKNTSGWEIVTPDGVKFYFPNEESYTEKTLNTVITAPGFSTNAWGLSGSIYVGYADDSLTKEEFKKLPDLWSRQSSDPYYRKTNESTNMWYLSKMSSSKHNAEISFIYESQGDIEDYYVEEQKMDYVRTEIKNYSSNWDYINIEPNKSFTSTREENLNYEGWMSVYANPDRSYFNPILKVQKSPKYLSKIIFSEGELDFINKVDYRNDLPLSYALDKIVLKDYNAKNIKEFKFEYDYFIEYPDINHNESSRLKLERFYEVKEGKENKKYTFEYDENNKLPHKHSKKQDYWGYFNNNVSNTLITKGRRHFIDFIGADRSPNEDKMKTWMLKKINYPTGGFNEISYEINTFVSHVDRIERPVGGLRVSQIRTNDERFVNNSFITDYKYSAGRTVNYLDNNWWRHYQSDSKFFHYHNGIQKDYKFIRRSSHAMYPLLKTKGGIVGYGSVTVSKEGNGQTEYRFTNPESHPDEKSIKTKFPFRDQNGSDLYHDNVHISKEPLRGLLISKTIKDESNKLNYYEFNMYEENPQNIGRIEKNSISFEKEYAMSVVTGFDTSPMGSTIPVIAEYLNDFSLVNYGKIKSYFPFVKEKRIRKYDVSSNSYVEEVQAYKRESFNNMQTTEIKSVNSDKTEAVVNLYYPNDDFEDSLLSVDEINSFNKLFTQNRIEPVRVINYLRKGEDFRKKHESFVLYKQFNNGIFLPKKVQTSKGTQTLKDRVVYHAYDNKGNPTEVSKKDGTHIVYIWGYQQTQPIAKIENAKLSDISEATITNLQTLSNQDNDRTIRNIGKEGALRAALNILRTSLPKAQVTTFTYDPLIGVTSITDPRGETIYYEYDDFNRLEFIKDADGNLLKEHKYKYKN